ncbi:MAG TPA: hypothetical protein VGX25_17700 [Actinophytocola sp.]|uniref:hypothetical protein n=1 Tax=Actinophytocola sp. TaxID=1872138 RepID=UPI002DDCFB3F|nr:hypothetical protein [Actinophytocola sp.]HEV2781219.1 hypothetical protein [Actinophytocola sp.]
MRRLILLGIPVLLGILACGAQPAVVAPATGRLPVSPTTPEPPPTAGAQAWASFPVDRKPRPILLLSRQPSMEGFTTDAAKLAALNGNLELAAELPAAPPTVVAQLPDGPAEFPTLPAERALADLRKELLSSQKPNPTDALPITRVELGSAAFPTDRGLIALPAWLFHPVDALGPIGWPALPPEAFWPQTAPRSLAPAAKLVDDTTLTVHLPAPPPACPGQPIYRRAAAPAESATTVMINVRTIPVSTAPGAAQPTCAHDLAMRFEPHRVTLAAPLGARVLLDDRGAPIAVTP